jgi:hypothetical protein
MINRQQKHRDHWVLRHSHFDCHNHLPSPNPFTLEPHISCRPGFADTVQIAQTHRSILSFSDSKEVLKRLGLTIDANRYYNLMRKEQTRTLNPQEEALMLLHYLESRDVHVMVDEQYVLDKAGNKKDRVILCIV